MVDSVTLLHRTLLQLDADWWLEWINIIGLVLVALILAFAVAGLVIYFFIPILKRADWTDFSDEHDAIRILRERYAQGEIDEEEFERRETYLRNRDR